MNAGADTNWTEPDGTVVDKAEIRTWLAGSDGQLYSQEVSQEMYSKERNYAFCEVDWYDYEYPLYARRDGPDDRKYYRDKSLKRLCHEIDRDKNKVIWYDGSE